MVENDHSEILSKYLIIIQPKMTTHYYYPHFLFYTFVLGTLRVLHF